MAAVGLHETYARLRREGLRLLGLTPATTELSDDGVWFTDMMRSAVRRAYWPGPVMIRPGQAVTPDWTFLKQYTTLTVYGEYNTGTVEVFSSSKTVTLSDGTWPAWLSVAFEQTPILTITEADGTAVECEVASMSGADITLVSNWPSSAASGLSYTLSAPESYAVSYDSIVGPVLVTDPSPVREYHLSDWMRVQALQAETTGFQGGDGIVGFRPATKTGANAETFRMNVWPQFDGTLTYRYRVTPSMMDAADSTPETYAYGPPWFHEAMLESVLAVCEERRDGVKGMHNTNFQAAMAAAALFDMHSEPDVYGTIVRQGAEQATAFSRLSHYWPRSGEVVRTS